MVDSKRFVCTDGCKFFFTIQMRDGYSVEFLLKSKGFRFSFSFRFPSIHLFRLAASCDRSGDGTKVSGSISELAS